MGLLPKIADGVAISIPAAGHVVSAYALGVVVGAPADRRLGRAGPAPDGAAVADGRVRRWATSALAFAASYPVLMAARFVSGLPHGAFFGIGARRRRLPGPAAPAHVGGLDDADRPDRRQRVGVPLTTLIGQHLGWQLGPTRWSASSPWARSWPCGAVVPPHGPTPPPRWPSRARLAAPGRRCGWPC